MLAFPAARLVAHQSGRPLPARQVALREAIGCVLAEPLRALVSLPPFDTAAMDGWAVCGDGPWRLVGRVLAGGDAVTELLPDEAVEVATGSPVPPGADAVIPRERGVLGDGVLVGALEAGRHIRRRGEECGVGTTLLPAGSVLSPAALGLAAAVGYDDVLVRPVPRVHALITGDELLRRGRPRDSRIRDAIGPMLEAAVPSYGGLLVGLDHLPDDGPLLAKTMAGADADVIVTTGASSVGPADFLPFALAALDAELLVDGVRVRPGHPQVLARLPSGALVVGLPGNPLAALAAMVTLLAPVLAGLGGKPMPATARGVLTERVNVADDDHRLIPVQCDGRRLTPCEHAGSAMLRGAAMADAFAVLAPGAAHDAEAEVDVLFLP